MSMTSTDPISDMLTRIRNSLMVRKSVVRLPHSSIKQSVAQILADQRYIENVTVEGEGTAKELVLTVADEDGMSPITEMKRISKPGRRVYVKVKNIPVVKQGRGMVIMSTPKGIMTGDSAKQQKLGGEVICQVY